MMKGQDTMACPLLTDVKENDIRLKDKLTECCTKGLRTLVAGYSILDASFWHERKDEYERVRGLDTSTASEGHPGKCDKANCEKCAQHNFYNQVEQDAQLKYLGIVGMEDQLQIMVPQTIQDCLRSGIRVWMITGIYISPTHMCTHPTNNLSNFNHQCPDKTIIMKQTDILM